MVRAPEALCPLSASPLLDHCRPLFFPYPHRTACSYPRHVLQQQPGAWARNTGSFSDTLLSSQTSRTLEPETHQRRSAHTLLPYCHVLIAANCFLTPLATPKRAEVNQTQTALCPTSPVPQFIQQKLRTYSRQAWGDHRKCCGSNLGQLSARQAPSPLSHSLGPRARVYTITRRGHHLASHFLFLRGISFLVSGPMKYSSGPWHAPRATRQDPKGTPTGTQT